MQKVENNNNNNFHRASRFNFTNVYAISIAFVSLVPLKGVERREISIFIIIILEIIIYLQL